jgi:hypothetical protein
MANNGVPIGRGFKGSITFSGGPETISQAERNAMATSVDAVAVALRTP